MSLRLPRLFKFMAGSAFVLTIAAIAYPQECYKGKTIVFIVGTAPGGGFDTYSRIAARHIGKHIPGNPNTMVQNMPGAGNLIAANYVYNKAEPDGLTIGHFSGSMIFKPVLARISHDGFIVRAESAENTFTSMIRGGSALLSRRQTVNWTPMAAIRLCTSQCPIRRRCYSLVADSADNPQISAA